MNFLIDECLHTSLVEVAQSSGHEASHVVWLGLSGQADWDLMPRIVGDDFTFVTNNARDFRKLYSNEPLHAGLVILLPQVPPVEQRKLFGLVLSELRGGDQLVNEAIEIRIVDGEAEIIRYHLPEHMG
jgi:predicted nuclease of predicted toxin-antitoxin system